MKPHDDDDDDDDKLSTIIILPITIGKVFIFLNIIDL
jgi:hypothetical protein